MKTILAVTGLVVVVATSAPASAKSVTFNQPYTNSCYESASLNASKWGVSQCSVAITTETTTAGGGREANLVNRGIMRLAVDDVPAAVRDFDEALSIDPGQAEAWLGKAIAQWQTGESADAVVFATKAIQHGLRRPAVAYFIRGLANEQQGHLRAAYSDLKKARQLEPQWAEPTQQLQRYRVVSR
jgi:tetratricopeptide (TPR) repeat protein